MTEETMDEATAADEGPKTIDDAMASLPPEKKSRLQLMRIAGMHLLVWLVTMGLFAASDSWRMLTDIGMASLMAIVTGALAGVTTTTLIHEWGHFIGAQRSGGQYTIPKKTGLFIYDWDFKHNSVDQFWTMSVAGTIGGAVSLVLIWMLLPPETLARAAVFAGGIAGFAFAARIEWPVLRAVREGSDPLAELSKINERVLQNSLVIATIAGLLTLWWVAP